MWHFFRRVVFPYIREHTKVFWSGFTIGGVVWGNILFLNTSINIHPALAFVLKVVGAGLIAFVSGIGTSLGNDFYKKIKPIAITNGDRMRKRIKYFFNRIKPKKNERSEKDTEERA